VVVVIFVQNGGGDIEYNAVVVQSGVVHSGASGGGLPIVPCSGVVVEEVAGPKFERTHWHCGLYHHQAEPTPFCTLPDFLSLVARPAAQLKSSSSLLRLPSPPTSCVPTHPKEML
jgi:hypothetical protein